MVTYTTLIDGLCKKGMLERTDILFSKMMEDGVEPNSVVYTLL